MSPNTERTLAAIVASLGIAAITALIIGFLVLGKIKPAPPTTENTGPIDSDRNQSISKLSDLVKNNPEVFSQIVEAWAGSGESSTPQEVDDQKAA